MKIKDGWELKDEVSGLHLTAVAGKHENRLHVEGLDARLCNNRDFFFDKKGNFTGTGSAVRE